METWNLETLKDRNRKALEEYSKTRDAVNEVAASIEQTESAMRFAMSREAGMNLLAIQEAHHFLEIQQGVLRSKQAEKQRAAQKLTQVEAQLKEAALYVKGLSQVKDSSDKAINMAREKQESELNAELWMQRFGQKELQSWK